MKIYRNIYCVSNTFVCASAPPNVDLHMALPLISTISDVSSFNDNLVCNDKFVIV